MLCISDRLNSYQLSSFYAKRQLSLVSYLWERYYIYSAQAFRLIVRYLRKERSVCIQLNLYRQFCYIRKFENHIALLLLELFRHDVIPNLSCTNSN